MPASKRPATASTIAASNAPKRPRISKRSSPKPLHVRSKSKTSNLRTSNQASSAPPATVIGTIKKSNTTIFDPVTLEATLSIISITIHSGTRITEKVTTVLAHQRQSPATASSSVAAAAVSLACQSAESEDRSNGLESMSTPTTFESTTTSTITTSASTTTIQPPTLKSSILALHAQARYANKLISIIEIAKRELTTENVPFFQYVRLYTRPRSPPQPRRGPIKQQIRTDVMKLDVKGLAQEKAEELGGTEHKSNKSGREQGGGQNFNDTDDDDDEPAFEPLSEVLARSRRIGGVEAQVKEMPMLVVYLAREKVRELEGEKG